MEEVLTIRVPKGTRRKLAQRARADKLTLSQYVRRALETEGLLGSFEAARADLVPIARGKGVYTDDDVFAVVSPCAIEKNLPKLDADLLQAIV